MRPWERRLRDLAQLLHNCGEVYFSPDRFRQNTNQFLQTSRTVTFIIQKNKATIPDFDTWYKENVLLPWADDPVMSWAKDARNVIEKEGDLEMQSTLRATVLFSYLSNEDMILETSRKELLQADIDRLLRAAFLKLPRGVSDAAVLKIQRRWVANSLPDYELIYAFTYAYAQLHRICSALAVHIGLALDTSVPHPTEIDPSSNDVARIRFMKFGKPGIGKHVSTRIDRDPGFITPPWLKQLKEELELSPKLSSLSDALALHAKMAQLTFENHGNHVPMLTLYDKNWEQIDFISTVFSDQADKFLFWRNVADRAFYLKANALIWTSECWLRNVKEYPARPIRDLPIVGEQLQIVGADAAGSIEVVTWDIARPSATNSPVLTRFITEDTPSQTDRMFFIEPVLAAMKMVRTNRTS